MKVAIDGRKIADYGIGTYIRGLLGGLSAIAERGDEYVVLAPASAARLIPFEHVAIDEPHYSIRELVGVGRALRKIRADVFHAPHYVVPFTATPTVVTIHDLIHLRMRHRNPLAPFYARTMLARAVRKSARVLTVSDAVRREIETTFAVRGVTVTPNGVDTRFVPGGPRREGRYFLFAGNDKPHKNVDRLVDAFEEFRRGPGAEGGWELVLAGAPFERFRGRATLAGFVSDDDLAALYRGATALVAPSLEEGFGLPAAEAMACGTPVITSSASALVEVTGDAALHVDAADGRAIAAAIARVAFDDALRATLRERGLARAHAFTWRRCAEITRDVYRAVAE